MPLTRLYQLHSKASQYSLCITSINSLSTTQKHLQVVLRELQEQSVSSHRFQDDLLWLSAQEGRTLDTTFTSCNFANCGYTLEAYSGLTQQVCKGRPPLYAASFLQHNHACSGIQFRSGWVCRPLTGLGLEALKKSFLLGLYADNKD